MGKFEHSGASDAREAASGADCHFPADFLPEEAEFASELRAFFPPEREELPPLYVQTLVGDGRSTPFEASFEQKVTYSVFSRLHLERRPLVPTPIRRAVPWDTWLGASVRLLGNRRATVAAAFVIFMVVSVLLTSPSFAAGVRILLGHTGVQQVQNYPASTRLPVASTHSRMHAVNEVTAVEWLGPAVGQYNYQQTYVNMPQEWSDGPVVEMLYDRAGATQGSGEIDVREFRMARSLASVLQVVADGHATEVTVNGLPGVYVDGRWVSTDRHKVWQTGEKSELIFEQDGMIFWIVGDQRDGIGQNQLVAAAQQLVPIELRALGPTRSSLRLVGRELQDALQNPISDEVLALIPAGSSPESGPAAFVVMMTTDPPHAN
jgi:hypothetical protein